MAGDGIRFEASFTKLDQAVVRFVRTLEEQLVVYKAEGDQVRAAQVEARIAAVKGPTTASRQAPQIAEANAALSRENTLKQLGQRIDVEQLNTIRAQNQARIEQLAVVERLQRRSAVPYGPTGVPYMTTGASAERIAAQQRIETEARVAQLAALQQRTPEGLVVPNAGRGGVQSQLAGQQVAAIERQAALNAEVRSYDEQLAAETALREQSLAVEREQLALDRARAEAAVQQQAQLAAMLSYNRQAKTAGLEYGAAGQLVPPNTRKALMAGPTGLMAGEWGKEQAQLVRLNMAMGEYSGLATRDNLSTSALNANLTRLGISANQASSSMRRHGALTTEYLQALARGETTVGEFGYQVGATIGKFAGWTAAATATYTALGAVFEFGKGAVDAASGVQQLTRTIDNLDRTKASQALEGLSQATNVPMKEAADATFFYSRTFHDLADATTAARNGLAVFKLDNVSLQDSMRLSTTVLQQFGQGAQQQSTMWNMLAAAQRIYNARISETVPALRASTGAVKNAGGDLNQLIQLMTLATRVYPGIPGQIGTAFARGSATYTPKNLPALRQQFGLGYGEEATNWTKLMMDAIQKSATMTGTQRRQLAGLIFDPRYGSRIAGIFGPQAATTLNRITGAGPAGAKEAITPQGTKGALQTELDRELGRMSERLHSFINEMQRMGAALGASGIVSILSTLISVLTGVGGAVRSVLDEFDGLSNAAKLTVEGLVAARVAMLFLSRTQFGGSLAQVTRLNRVPGLGMSEATSARQSLRTGTRAAMQAVQSDIEQSSQAFLVNGARQVELERQKAAIEGKIAQTGVGSVGEYEAANKISMRIEALQGEQLAIETQYNAQLEAFAGLKVQQTRLRRNVARGGFTDAETLALNKQVTSGTIGAEAAGASMVVGATAAGDTAALSRMAAAKVKVARLLHLNAAASREATLALDAEAAATSELTLASSAEATASTGMIAKLGGLVGSMDPMLLGLIALPMIYGDIKKSFDAADAAAGAATTAAKEATPTVAALQQKAKDLADAAKKQRDAGKPHGFFENVVNLATFGLYGGQKENNASPAADKTQAQADALKTSGDLYQGEIDKLRSDAAWMTKTAAGRVRWLAEVDAARRRANNPLGVPGQGLDVFKAIGTPITGPFTLALGKIKNLQFAAGPADAFRTSLTDLQQQIMGGVASATKSANDFISTLENLSDKQLKGNVQAYGNRSTVYGLNKGDLAKAAQSYLFLAARERNSTDQASLQAVSQAQQAFVSGVNKQVQDLLNVSQSATTFHGQSGALNQAIGKIQMTKQGVRQWASAMERRYRAYPAIVKAIEDAAAQLDAALGSQLKTAISQQLQLIQAQSGLAASRIQGISPQADIARAEAALAGLQAELAAARKDGADYQTIAGLLTQIGTATQALIQQKIANADAIAQAQQTLALSSITGIGPGADMARAQQTVTNATQTLARDRSEGKGIAQILLDQAAVNDAQRALAQQAQSNAQTVAQDASAFIQAQSDLAQAQTTDPVKQAREQLAADLQILSTISPSDYTTYQEYQTAVLEQQAKIAKDRQNVTSQYVSVQEQSLQFELHTQRITDQQYVAGLENLLKTKKLSLQQRQQLLTEIFDATHQAAVSLNLGDIKMPTTYEVKRAIEAAGARRYPSGGAGLAQSTTNNNTVTNNINVVVHRNADLREFARVFDDTLKTNFGGTAQAMGLI